MPKMSPEVVFKPIFLGPIRSFFTVFLPLSALKCPAIICSSSCKEQSGLSGRPHVSRSGSHWFHLRNSWRKKVMGKTLRWVSKSWSECYFGFISLIKALERSQKFIFVAIPLGLNFWTHTCPKTNRNISFDTNIDVFS